MWPYSNPTEEMFKSKILSVEKMLENMGAVAVEENSVHTAQWDMTGVVFDKKINQFTWKYKEEYFRVNEIWFPEKPFIVIEHSNKLSGPFDDADPFPYDLPDEEILEEIKFVLGIGEE